ncbi:MAG: hypothetical protein H7222_16165 [Methylotenera sp.]|nr:hypothetical protein [Oligoflexia bacterium]
MNFRSKTFTPLLILSLSLISALVLSGRVFAAATASGSSPEEELLLQGATPEQACSFQYLKRLGWRVASGELEVTDGNPCEDDSLAESLAQDKLTIKVPANLRPMERQSALEEIVRLTHGSKSMCAYKHLIRNSVLRATQQLGANARYEFSRHKMKKDRKGVEYDDGKLISMGLFTRGWKKSKTEKGHFGFEVSGKPSRAIDAFYHSSIHGDCAVGIQMAQYATQYELYGKKDFNQAFDSGEIVIGDWEFLGKTHSALQTSDISTIDQKAAEVSKLGQEALVGLSGYINNVNGWDSLDDKADQAENFVITSVSAQAGRNLRTAGGFAKYDVLNVKIWQLLVQANQLGDLVPEIADLRQQIARAEYVGESTQALQNSVTRIEGSDSMIAPLRAQVNELFKDEVYTDIKVYVHPLGIMNFAQHLTRLARMNPRTPYTFNIHPDTTNADLFGRHANYFISECLKSKK